MCKGGEAMVEPKIAMVTGANRGLGFEISRQLGLKAMTVLVGARDSEKGEKAAVVLRGEGLDARAIALDVVDSASITSAVEAVRSDFGKLDVLVNNAAVLLDIGVQPSDVKEEVLRSTFEVNFFGPYRLTQQFVPLLKKSRRGRIVNLATQVASLNQLADPNSPFKDDICPAYQASKAALNVMTLVFAKELRESGIKVNSVCPGWVMTDMGHDDLPDYGDAIHPMPPPEAVEKLIWLTELTDDGPTGGFFREGEPVPW
jgi:NAD(P)-dependent dehydrogenase (short-subunit alcohol dehydrogenase family)